MTIYGLTLKQYVKFNAEAQKIVKNWKQIDKQEIHKSIKEVYIKYNQDINILIYFGKFEYNFAGMIAEWEEIISRRSDLLIKFKKYQSEYLNK